MPVLPIIDLLIFMGWTSLLAGGVLKAIYIATSYRPTLFSLAPSDLMLVALGFLGLALTLAARTWVRLNEPRLTSQRRAAASRQAVSRALAQDQVVAEVIEEDDPPQPDPAGVGQWQRVR
jgi:hypothetical protein